MRPFEIFIVAFLVSAAVCLLTDRWRKVGRLLVILAVVAVLAHVGFEGAHWQMAPAYVAAVALCVLVSRPWGKSQSRIMAASSVLLLVAGSVLLSILLPMFHLPRPTGPYVVGTRILYLKDPSRIEDAVPGKVAPRELMVQIWYPAQPSHHRLARYREPRETRFFSSYQSVLLTHSHLDAPVVNTDGPFPVILFNHAWSGRRTNDTFLTEELASHGYVVASIDHTYNASLVAFPDGRVMAGNAPMDISAPEISTPERVRQIWDKELLKWTADQQFVLDQLELLNKTPDSPWFHHLNTNLAGAIGHSFGGAAATEVCGVDTRVRSAVNMDGWFFGAIQARGANQALLALNAAPGTVPDTLVDPVDKVTAALDAEDNAGMEASLHRFGGYLLLVRGAEHEDFTDQPLVSPLRHLSHRGTVPAERIQAMVRSYVLAFFDKTLRGQDPPILHQHSGPFVEASLEAWPANKAATVAAVRLKGQ